MFQAKSQELICKSNNNYYSTGKTVLRRVALVAIIAAMQALLDCVQERYEEMESDSNINTTVSTDGLEELNWN